MKLNRQIGINIFLLSTLVFVLFNGSINFLEPDIFYNDLGEEEVPCYDKKDNEILNQTCIDNIIKPTILNNIINVIIFIIAMIGFYIFVFGKEY